MRGQCEVIVKSGGNLSPHHHHPLASSESVKSAKKKRKCKFSANRKKNPGNSVPAEVKWLPEVDFSVSEAGADFWNRSPQGRVPPTCRGNQFEGAGAGDVGRKCSAPLEGVSRKRSFRERANERERGEGIDPIL